ncbi:MAG: hypothetical protein ACO1QB_13850 [Verrucomicrobiales bacterium]
MKSKLTFTLLAAMAIQLTGCVAIPPLINVHESSDGASKSRIESLERRIERLEEKIHKDETKI